MGGQCDVRQGPLVLHVPDTHDRYYALQFIDAWTNNFAYIGRRATGTAEAEYLLTDRDYDGPIPDGMRVVAAPTGVFTIVGRVQLNGEADLPAVHALQDQFTVTPWRSGPAGAAPAEVAGPRPRAGRGAGRRPTSGPGQDRGAGQGRRGAPGGWSSALHAFDYNLDHLGLGTIDAPEWKIPDRAKAYVMRAMAARAGLWGNHGYEADYAFAWTDGDGQPLDGANRYELRLESPPPVDAFWSLTMYDVPDFYLVANPIDRYSIGDRTPGLQTGRDGSVTIYLQTDSPGPGKDANWLPTPAGAFRPIMRMYQPLQPILDGTYVLPAVRKVG